MAAWQVLFEVAVQHGFFAPARCEGLRLLPSPAAAAWLARSGALLRPTADGIAVLHDAPAHAAAMAGRWHAFELLLSSQDPWFGAYTEGLAPGQLGAVALEADDAVAADGWRNAPPPATASPWPPGRPGTPALLLCIGLGPWLARIPCRWRVTLAPRHTHWKYLLPAEWAPQQPQVLDPSGAIAFEPVATTALADGRASLVTHSRQAIPLAARPTQQFVLRAAAPLADPILVQRLPVASAAQLGLETIAGVRTLVSEIYVNR